MDEIERDKAKYNETCQTLKSEIGDLHGMLDAMEHSSQDAELRHVHAVELLKEENSLLNKDIDKARKDIKLAKETILKTQKEVTEMHAEAAGLRAQLQDALNDAHQYQQNSSDCMHANEQLRQSLMGAQENISEIIKLRKDDEILYLQQLKNYQEGKGTIEEAPAETTTSLERQCSKYGHHGEIGEELAMSTFYQSKRRPLHLDMTHLAQRQIKLLDSLAAT